MAKMMIHMDNSLIGQTEIVFIDRQPQHMSEPSHPEQRLTGGIQPWVTDTI